MSTMKLLAVGDICLQTKKGKDPFKMVEGVFNSDKILFGNLETVLSSKGKEIERAVPLHVSIERAIYLKNAGFDILNIGNNHTMDMGKEGFNETLDVLNQNNIRFVGGGNWKFNKGYEIIEKNNIKIGFLGYCQFNNKTDGNVYICDIQKDSIIRDVNNLKPKCDFIVISLHWGIENVFYPSPEQIKLGRDLIDGGASLILGHHPSVVQGIERYKKGLIVYSLGNFQFIDDAPSYIVEKTKETMIFCVEFSRKAIENYEIIPVGIDEDYIPCPMSNEAAKEMLSFIDLISRPIANGKINERWWFEQIAEGHLLTNISAWIIRIKRYGIKHFLMCLRWLISRFTVKCYMGLLRNQIRRYNLI